MTKSYLLAFLKYTESYLSREDFSKMLADIWIRTEAPNLDPNFKQKELLDLFRKSKQEEMMTEDEIETLRSLPETVSVYRGVTSYNAGKVKALSWTLDQKVAQWFANRFGENGTVYEAEISKEHILALFKGRNEWEVIGFANNATICTFAAAYRCLAHAFPYFHSVDEDDELLSSVIVIPKISRTSFIISFGYTEDGMEDLLYKYARNGARSAIADLRRCGITATYKESQGFSLFNIDLAESFGEQKDYAVDYAEYRLNPPKADFNFDDPLAGLPFEDE